jgi:predicted nucleic acid-binding protein
MKRYLLDTSPLAAYLQQREPAVRLIRPLIERHEVATSSIVYAEVIEYRVCQVLCGAPFNG